MVLEVFDRLHRSVGKVVDGTIFDANGNEIGLIDYPQYRFYDNQNNLLLLVHKCFLFTNQGNKLCMFHENSVSDTLNNTFLNVDNDKIKDSKNNLIGYIKGECPIRKSVVIAALLSAYTIDLF